LLNNIPALIVELVSSQLERFVHSNTVNWLPIFESKDHHVMDRVPTHDNISRDKFVFKAMGLAELSPGWEGNGGRMNNCKGKLLKL